MAKKASKHTFKTGVAVDNSGNNLENLEQVFDAMCHCKFDCCLNAIVLNDNKTGETTYIVVENGSWVFYTDVEALKAAKTV